ncbi:hypothetical protein SSAG_05690, partial [Streptomyces sp. Mg1]
MITFKNYARFEHVQKALGRAVTEPGQVPGATRTREEPPAVIGRGLFGWKGVRQAVTA